MFDRRAEPHDAAPHPLLGIRTWLGAGLGLGAEPRLRAPPVPRLPRIRRGLLAAVREARGAVATGIGLADYLRARLAHYDASLAVPRARLPLRIELAGDELRSTLVASGDLPAGGPTHPADPAAALELLDGPSTLREWAEARARRAALGEEAAAAQRRAEALADRISADVAAGTLAPAPLPEGETPATSLGRPRLRGPGLLWTLTGIAGATVLAEAWAIAVPLLLLADAYPPRAAGPGAIEALVLLAFALGAAMGLLGLASLALGAAAALARDAGPRGERRLRKAALVFAFAAAASAAGATAGAAPRSGLPPPGHALLLLALPAGAALVARRAQREHAARAQELAAALAWDRERAAALAERARRQEELEWAEWEARAAQRRLARTRARIAALTRRAARAAHLVERAARHTHQAELRLAQSLLAALERDRYEYLREASALRRAGDALARPPAPESHPAAPERAAPGRIAV